MKYQPNMAEKVGESVAFIQTNYKKKNQIAIASEVKMVSQKTKREVTKLWLINTV